jgi:ribosomal protein S18 acetylase RimI-like enzyme
MKPGMTLEQTPLKADSRTGRSDRVHTMTIRAMEEEDISAVSEMLCECYRWLGEREGLRPDQTEFLVSKRGSIECIARESTTEVYLVASRGREIVGMVSVSGNQITKLYVAPARHGQQIGRRLFAAAEARIRAAGHKDLMLGAFPTAVPFYTAMGLSVKGQRPCGPAPLAGLSMTLMEKRMDI